MPIPVGSMEPFKDYHIKMRSHMAHRATSLLPYGLGLIIWAVVPADGVGLATNARAAARCKSAPTGRRKRRNMMILLRSTDGAAHAKGR